MTTKQLYLTTKESSTGGEPEDDGRWARRSDIIVTVDFISVSREKPEGFFSCATAHEVSEEVYNAEQVFLVIPRFFDGGTFGTTRGNWTVQEVCLTEEQAISIADSIRNKTYKGDGYLAWTGYFAGLEDVEIHCFKIKDKSTKGNRVTYHA